MVKLILDEMLGNTASWLRIFGVDAEYIHPANDEELLECAKNQNRILITRDRELALRAKANGIGVFYIKSTDVKEQLKRIVKELGIKLSFPSPTRCPECNSSLKIVQKQEVRALVPTSVFAAHSKFWLCRKCGKAYWEGSHWKNIIKMYKYIVKKQH